MDNLKLNMMICNVNYIVNSGKEITNDINTLIIINSFYTFEQLKRRVKYKLNN